MMKSHINETHFELYSRNYSEPDRVKGLWFVIWMCFLEYFLLWLEKKPLPHPKENILSVCHGIFYYLIKVWIRSTEYFAYIWLWENYSLFPMWFSESWSSFFGTVIFVDFCYYWFHRFSHEVMLFWAIHQVHHLSLDLTVSVGIRHSPIQSLFSWVFYLPLAIIGLPVSHLKAHLHVNHMYQIWVHTEAVDKIGPLEWVMNTPSHHRVHHGIIERVIDKNYGGIFIIWDRLFGTFTPEENRDDNIYGVLNQTQSWNIFSQQTFYLQHAIEKAKTMSNGLEFFNTFWKGPSWEPGYSRLGRELEIDYDYSLNRSQNKAYTSGITDLYILVHIIALLCLLMKMTENMETSITSSTAFSILIITTLVNMGLIYEGRSIAGKIELLRCFAGVILVLIFPLSKWEVQLFILILYSSSVALWLIMNLGNILINNLHKMHQVKNN